MVTPATKQRSIVPSPFSVSIEPPVSATASIKIILEI